MWCVKMKVARTYVLLIQRCYIKEAFLGSEFIYFHIFDVVI